MGGARHPGVAVRQPQHVASDAVRGQGEPEPGPAGDRGGRGQGVRRGVRMNVYEVRVLFPGEPDQRYRRMMARNPADAVEKAIKQVMARAGGSSRQYPAEMFFQVKL